MSVYLSLKEPHILGRSRDLKAAAKETENASPKPRVGKNIGVLVHK